MNKELSKSDQSIDSILRSERERDARFKFTAGREYFPQPSTSSAVSLCGDQDMDLCPDEVSEAPFQASIEDHFLRSQVPVTRLPVVDEVLEAASLRKRAKRARLQARRQHGMQARRQYSDKRFMYDQRNRLSFQPKRTGRKYSMHRANSSQSLTNSITSNLSIRQFQAPSHIPFYINKRLYNEIQSIHTTRPQNVDKGVAMTNTVVHATAFTLHRRFTNLRPPTRFNRSYHY